VIGKVIGGVAPFPVANDQGLPVVFDVATDGWWQAITLWEVVMLMYR